MEKILDEYNCETYKLSGSIYNKLTELQNWEQYYKNEVGAAKRYLESFRWTPDNTNEYIVYSQELRVGHIDPTDYLDLYQSICAKIEEVVTGSFYYLRVDETRVTREDFDGYDEEFIRYDLVFESYDSDGYKSTQKYKQALQDYQECLEKYNSDVERLQDFLDTLIISK